MTEGVKIDGRLWRHAKFFPEIFLTGTDLADEGLAGRHVAVRLQVPAPHDVPFSGLHQFLNPLKQRQIVLLNPLIEQSLVVIENKTVVILAEICRRMEGGEGRGNALLHVPEPDRVQMGVADEIECLFLHIGTSLSTFY